MIANPHLASSNGDGLNLFKSSVFVPIAAPTIYEKGESNIYVPHGHHENLHVRPTKGKYNYLIDYDKIKRKSRKKS